MTDRANLPPVDSGQALARAAALVRAGRFAAAEALCRQALAAQPAEPTALHLLGVCLLQQARYAEAEQALAACLQAQPGEPSALGNLGIALHGLGRFDEALACYAQSLACAPGQPAVLNMQGLALLERKRPDEALASFDRAVALAPNLAELWCNRANALIHLQRHDEALASLDRAEALRPDYGEALSNRSIVLNLLGRHGEALASAQRALALLPGRAIVHRSLADALAGLRRFEVALPHYDRAIELDPGDGFAHRARARARMERKDAARALTDIEQALAQLGESVVLLCELAQALHALGRAGDASAALDRALALKDETVGARHQLAEALFDLQRWDDALAAFTDLVAMQPDDAGAHNTLGLLHQRKGHTYDAERHFKRALELDPALFGAHNNLGLLLQQSDRLVEAEASFRAALRLNPKLVGALSNLAGVCQTLGRPDDAEANLRLAVSAKPEFLEIQSNLLFLHTYQARLSPEDELREAREYGRRAAERAAHRYRDWGVTRDPQQLRVGLVSGDLREHPVGHFLEGLLAHIDPERIQLVAYPTQPAGDALTERIRPRFSAWTPLHGQTDAEAARLIHADGTHVLIDLAGHTAYNRLPVFAYKPAPVQVSWLGYFATTGVEEIDYLLADPVSVPLPHRQHFTETVWYLPDTRLCFTPPREAPDVAPLPALGRGYITLGCFQNLAKVNDDVLALWARVFTELPSTRLLLHSKPLADPAVRQQFGERLRRAGIPDKRVSMRGALSRQDYLAAHAEVDLILDTFPFPGGTTTCEALWMGVPTLTLTGDRLIGLQGASLLAAAGLTEWIAATPAASVEKALAFAGDLNALAALRASLRGRLIASPLCDAPRFAKHLQDALWGMWRRWAREDDG